MLGLRLQVFMSVSVGVITRLALQQEELAIIGQRHVLHQLGQSFRILRRETHNICFNSSSRSVSVSLSNPVILPVWHYHRNRLSGNCSEFLCSHL